jgi:lysophospholipase L1-like esterase
VSSASLQTLSPINVEKWFEAKPRFVATVSSSRPPLLRRRKAAYSALVLLSLLGFGECAARVWLYYFASAEGYPKYAVASEFPTAAKYVPHHYLCYALQPHYRRGRTQHNSLGFRGREIASPKPRGVFRVAVLGGSTTYGEFIHDDAQTFPAQLERELHERYGRQDVEVINAGCPGYNSWESLQNLQFRVLDLEPNLVILYDGVNDVHARLVHPASYKADNSGRRRIWTPPIEVTLCRYSVLSRIVGYHLGLWRIPGVDSFVRAPTADPGAHDASSIIGGDPKDVLQQNEPIYFRRNLRNMVAVARANGVKVMMATWACSPLRGDYASTEHYQAGIAQNNAVVKETAREQQVELFDFAAVMPTDPRFWRDGRHVNESGAQRQGELFARFLAESKLLAH